jgi:hypothetical protein
MARTKTQDLRNLDGFKIATNLAKALRAAREKYTLSCEPPQGFLNADEFNDHLISWSGRKLDALFGLPKLREFASAMWETRNRLTKLGAGFDKDFSVLASGVVQLPEVPQLQHIFRIPRARGESPLLMNFVLQTYYPTQSVYILDSESVKRSLWHAGRTDPLRHADYRVLTQAQQAEVEALRAWSKETLVNKERALGAIDFLDVVFNCASTMRDVFDTLPGLDGILGALVGEQHVRDARVPKARSRPFDIQSLRAQYPNWTTLWPTHRATLLAMAIAFSQDWRVSSGTVVLYHRDPPPYPVDE